MPQEDHDLLIEIATQMKDLRADVKDIKTNTVGRVEKLEIEKANSCDVEKLKDRINTLENRRWYVVWIASILSIVAWYVVPKL
jgi:hypothetical protein